jgi:hypothetical protein
MKLPTTTALKTHPGLREPRRQRRPEARRLKARRPDARPRRDPRRTTIKPYGTASRPGHALGDHEAAPVPARTSVATGCNAPIRAAAVQGCRRPARLPDQERRHPARPLPSPVAPAAPGRPNSGVMDSRVVDPHPVRHIQHGAHDERHPSPPGSVFPGDAEQHHGRHRENRNDRESDDGGDDR